MNCKACGQPILESSLLSEFCEKCFWENEDTKPHDMIGGEEIFWNENESTNVDLHFGIIKKNIEKNTLYVISNKTLKPYLSLKAFDNFIVNNNLMIVKSDDELSVIKKSIL